MECADCHRDVVHKDYSPEEIKVIVTRGRGVFSDNSHAQDGLAAMKNSEKTLNVH
jgi:hypothetical protein